MDTEVNTLSPKAFTHLFGEAEKYEDDKKKAEELEGKR